MTAGGATTGVVRAGVVRAGVVRADAVASPATRAASATDEPAPLGSHACPGGHQCHDGNCGQCEDWLPRTGMVAHAYAVPAGSRPTRGSMGVVGLGSPGCPRGGRRAAKLKA